jgi:tetratricopeptide (TPR) repeat protein
MAERALGPDHPELGRFYNDLSTALELQERTRAEACRLRRKALALQERGDEKSNPAVMTTMTNLAACLIDQQRLEEAQRLLEEALARNPRPQHRALVHESFGYLLVYHRDQDAAGVAHYRQAMEDYQTAFGPAHDDALRMRNFLVMILGDVGRYAEARREADAALAVYQKYGVTSARLPQLYTYSALIDVHEKKYGTALPALEAALALHERLHSGNFELSSTLHWLGVANRHLGRIDQAVGYLERALSLRPATEGLAPANHYHSALALAEALAEQRHPDRSRACTLARDAASFYRRTPHPARLANAERFLSRQHCR